MFHEAIKLNIITEHFLARRVCRIIESSGGKGYTLTEVGGKGLHHFHPTSDSAAVIGEFAELKIELICMDRAMAEGIAERILKEIFNEHPGVMYLETVGVVRTERF